VIGGRFDCYPPTRNPVLGHPDVTWFYEHRVKPSPVPTCMHGRTLPGLCPHCAGINDTQVRKLPKGVVP
jgi:hypothetical protein